MDSKRNGKKRVDRFMWLIDKPDFKYCAPLCVVVRCACKASGITEEQFFSKCRKREHLMARTLACVYLERNSNLIHEDISEFIGKKSHSAVFTYKNGFNKLRLKSDKPLKEAREKFIKLIRRTSNKYKTEMRVYG